MKLLRNVALLTGPALALAAFTPATALAAAHGTDRPISGNFSGTTVLDLTAFSPGPPVVLTYTGPVTGSNSGATGNVSHLGKVSVQDTKMKVISDITDGSYTSTGQTTMVAANGDHLVGNFTVSGTFTGTTSHDTGVTTITGGTGRFLGASGTINVRSTHVASGTSTLTSQDTASVEGTISY